MNKIYIIMIKEVRVNNSKLRLLIIDGNEFKSFKVNKKILKYQLYGVIDHNNNFISSRSLIGESIIKLCSSEKAIILEKSNVKYENIIYKIEDLKYILSYLICTLTFGYVDTSEILSQSTGDREIIYGFYNSYGSLKIDEYISILKDKIKSTKLCINPIEEEIPKIYDRSKYSVHNLLIDLIEDDSKIYIGSDLLPKYNNISKRSITSDDAIRNENWMTACKLIGNKNRANLSLLLKKEVCIDIPKNNYVLEGKHNFPSYNTYCIIKDGILNQRYLGIDTSNKKLISKLKRLGIVRTNLLFENQFVVDLGKIPIVTKNDIRGVSSIYLSNIETNLKLTEFALEYISEIYPTHKTTDCINKENFLRKLGIINNIYYERIPSTRGNSREYDVIELVSTLNGDEILTMSKKRRILNYLEYSKNKKCSSKLLVDYFNSINIDKDPQTLRNILIEQRNKLIDNIRNRKFQLIMSKKLFFSDGYPIECFRTVNLPFTELKLIISWNFKNRKIVL